MNDLAKRGDFFIKLTEHLNMLKKRRRCARTFDFFCEKFLMRFLQKYRQALCGKGNSGKNDRVFLWWQGLDKIEQMCYNCHS